MTALSDFNDLAGAEGLEAVASIVGLAVSAGEPAQQDAPAAAPKPAWPEPMIPGVLCTPEVPCSLIPGVWGQIAQAVSDSTQTPPVMSVLTVLGVLATLLQKRFELDLGTHREVLAFWGVTVSPSGTRKSSVMGTFQRPLLRWEKLISDRTRREVIRNKTVIDTTLKRIEGLRQKATKADPEEMKALREEIEREEMGLPEEIKAPFLFTEDSTPETMQRLLSENHGRAAVLSDEPGLFRILGGMYSKGGASLEVFLKGHVGSALKVERSTRSVFIPVPLVSMILMIQPDLVQDLTGSNQFRASGLMARFFYGVPVSNVGSRNVRKRFLIPQALHDAYDAAVMNMLEGYPPAPGEKHNTETLVLDELAEDLWLDFSQEVEDQQGPGGAFDAIRDWTSKLPGAAARIAALLELATNGLQARTVSLESMDSAIKLCRLLVPHTQAAFGLLGADAVEADSIHVLKWAMGNKLTQFTRHEAQKAMEGRFRTVEKLQKAIDKLASMGCIRTETIKHLRGKRSVAITVNPAILS